MLRSVAPCIHSGSVPASNRRIRIRDPLSPTPVRLFCALRDVHASLLFRERGLAIQSTVLFPPLVNSAPQSGFYYHHGREPALFLTENNQCWGHTSSAEEE